MPRRYEIVEEPEALEVIEDDVYNPDQSVRDIHGSIRSLDPIIGEPISLKHIFYDPRWSINQRRFCLGVLAFIGICCLAVIISLFVGLGKVLAYISYTERIKESGLNMFPQPTKTQDTEYIPFCIASTPEKQNVRSCSAKSDRDNVQTYIEQIRQTLDHYKRTQKGNENFVECKDGKAPPQGQFCKVNVEELETNCTYENNYGYFNGTPCVLIQLRNVTEWTPELNSQIFSKIKSEAKFDEFHIPITCEKDTGLPYYSANTDLKIAMWPDIGFSISFIPKSNDDNYLPPMVMVQFTNLNDFFGSGYAPPLGISCRIHAANVGNLQGFQEIDFAWSANL